MPVLSDLYMQFLTKNASLQDPGSGATVQMCSKSHGTLTITSTGARKLPDEQAGTRLTVFASGAAATLQNSAGTHIVTIASGSFCDVVSLGSTTWKVANFNTQGMIEVPLAELREVTSNDITNAAGNGGLLATDSTPTLEYVNGDTDSQMRVLWAQPNADPVAFSFVIPPDLDRSQDITLNIVGDMVAGTTDTPVIDIDTFFGAADTKVEDATTAFGTTVATETATIAAADIPADASVVSMELTPGSRTVDAIAMYGIYLTYTKKVV
jgi:hypothetical protein